MSKEFKNIDDLFQSAFTDESAEVPSFVKDNIDKGIGFKRKKSGWIWFGSLMIVTLLIVGIVWINQPSALQHEQQLTQNDHPQVHPAELNSNADLSNQSAEQLDPANHTTPSHANAAGAEPNQTSHPAGHNTEYTNTTSSSDEASHSSSGDTSFKLTADEKISISSGSGPDLTESRKSGGQNDVQMTVGTNPSGTKAIQEKNSTDRFHTLTARYQELNARHTQQMAIHAGPVISRPVQFPYHTPSDQADANAIEPRNVYNPWMFSATTGLNLAKSTYTFDTPAEATSYNGSTQDKAGYEFNAEIKYRLENSLTFGTGLGLSELTENYDFFKESSQLDSTLTWTYFVDSTDTTGVFPIDSVSSYTYQSTTKTLYDETGVNQATYLHIPFSIGTQLVRNKFRFDLYAMGRVNYLIAGKGGYVASDSFYAFTKSQNPIFKTWSMDLMLGANVHYQLIEKLYLTGSFRFHPALTGIYQGLTFNRAIQSYHVGVGLSWNL